MSEATLAPAADLAAVVENTRAREKVAEAAALMEQLGPQLREFIAELLAAQTTSGLAPLYDALSKAQAEITAAEQNRENPHLKSRYATLNSVWAACRGPLTKNGLCLIQLPSYDGVRVHVETILAHKSGAEIRNVLTLVPAKADIQGVGSAQTYARRYSMSAVVGVCPDDDDDGAMASRQPDAPRQQAAKVPDAPPVSTRARTRTKAQEGAPEPAASTSTAAPPTNPHGEAVKFFYSAVLAADGVLGPDNKSIDQEATRAKVVARLKALSDAEQIAAPVIGLEATSESLSHWLKVMGADEIRNIAETYRAAARREVEAEVDGAVEAAVSPAEQVVGGMFDGMPS